MHQTPPGVQLRSDLFGIMAEEQLHTATPGDAPLAHVEVEEGVVRRTQHGSDDLGADAPLLGVASSDVDQYLL